MKKISEKIRREDVIEAILKKFGTQRACANALGIDETNLSNKLKRLSNRFLFELKSVGVDIPTSGKNYTIELNNNQVKENQQQYLNCIAEIEQLKRELTDTKKIISLSLNKITELETENDKLRAESAALLKTIAEFGGGKIGNKL